MLNSIDIDTIILFAGDNNNLSDDDHHHDSHTSRSSSDSSAFIHSHFHTFTLAGAVQTPHGSWRECRLGGKVVAASERGRGFMSRFFILMVMIMILMMKLVKLSQVSVTTDWAMTVIREDKERDQKKQTPRRRAG